MKVRFLAQSAMIAAVYAALTLVLAPISFGVVQVRLSEALCVLPLYTPAAIPGLFIGCLIANLVAGNGVLDVVLGSAATLAASALTAVLGKKHRFWAPLPAVVLNMAAVGLTLYTVTPGMSYWALCGMVGIGQAVACYGAGLPLTILLDRFAPRLFQGEPRGKE